MNHHLEDARRLIRGRWESTLMDWWLDLNQWKWPVECGEPEPRDEPHTPRRTAIMLAIQAEFGMRYMQSKKFGKVNTAEQLKCTTQ